MTYLGMQVLIEGLALAAFGADPQHGAPTRWRKALNAYVMQDEARHVMFGRLALRDYYPQLTQAERDEREEFCVDACYLMRDRFLGEEVWERLGLPPEVGEYVEHERAAARVPRLPVHAHRADPQGHRAVGRRGSRQAFADMGVLAFADADIDAAMADDEAAAEEIDREHDVRLEHVKAVANTIPPHAGT